MAKKAGISTATVSRVFINTGPVAGETRQRVLKASQKLRYTPNAADRSLSTRRTDSIGLLLPDIYGEFFSEVIRGADQTAQQNRYHLLVSSSHNHRDEIEAARRVMSGRVDGLILMSPQIDAQTLKSNLPLNLPDERLRGYRQALLENYLPASDALEISGSFSEESGYDAVKKNLALTPRPTAIFASNDAKSLTSEVHHQCAREL